MVNSGNCLHLKEKAKEYGIPTYWIEKQPYISLKSVLKLLECEGSWGRIEDRVFFIYKGKEIKFKIGHPEIVIGREIKKMEYSPKEVEGEVLMNLNCLAKVLNKVEVEETVTSGVEEKPSQKAEESPSVQKKEFIILIDPGHGGRDSGAVGNFGLREKSVNLDVSLRLRSYLKKKLKKCSYIKIYMTRKKDVYLSLEDRIQIAKDLNADIFFCIHTNSSRYNNLKATGFETYYPRLKKEMSVLPPPKNIEGFEGEIENETIILQIVQDLNQTNSLDESKILAEFVQEKLAERLLTPDRGAKHGNFYVLKYTPMLSVLTEIGFICNPNVEANLRDVEVRQAIGETLGDAIIKYLGRKKIILFDE